jgi:hypothetical protein
LKTAANQTDGQKCFAIEKRVEKLTYKFL